MAFVLFDADGYVGHLGTAKGMAALVKISHTKGAKGLKSFLEEGYTTEPVELAKELEAGMKKFSGPEKELIENLCELLKKAREVAIISDETSG